MHQQQFDATTSDPVATANPVLDASTAVAALTVSSSGEVLGANRGLRELLKAGSEREPVGRPLSELLARPEDRTPWQRALKVGETRGAEIELRTSRAASLLLRGDIFRTRNAAGEPRLEGVFVDVTQELQSRPAMQRGARLEALASLTSGVAHDFNNLLTVLVGNLSLVAEELRGRPDLFAKLKASRDAAKRGSDLIGQLLGFARSERVQTAVIDPEKIVEHLTPLLSRALGSRIALETDLRAQPSRLRANAAQLESVIVNLAVNARDAIESSGSVTISLTSVELSADEASGHALTAGSYVRLTVTDDGPGISSDDLTRVFEPFFSTKGDRGGTGLGLSMVRAFAEQSGGRVWIESRSGAGTAVIILLPATVEPLDETSAKTMPLSVLPTGDERVLVASTDESVRATVRQILETLGYAVHLCEDDEALAVSLQTDSYDLVITDGAGRAATSDPGVPAAGTRHIVLSSGTQRSAADGRARVLLKPFTLADLAQLVRETLDAPQDVS